MKYFILVEKISIKLNRVLLFHSESTQNHLDLQNELKTYEVPIEKTIEAAITNTDPNINIGVMLRDLSTGKVVYQLNSKRYFTFASALKVITATSLRQYFGNDYEFIDKILQKGDDYYLDINDPTFSEENLDQLLKSFKQKTFARPRNFYIVNSTFSLPSTMDTQMVEDAKSCDGAQITKVHINKNCLRLTLIANETSVKVENAEAIPYNIILNVRIVPNNYEDNLENIAIDGDNLWISGTLRENSTKYLEKVPLDNLNHVRVTLAKLLKKNDITINGGIFYGPEPVEALVFVEIHKNFYETAKAALAISDNFALDYLLAEYANVFQINNREKAGLSIKKIMLDKFSVDLSESVMVDGSGISRYNMFTPAQFDELFEKLYLDENFETIKLMLVQPGTGTLSNRFKGVKMFAKTGTLFGVSALVGYVYDKSDTPYSFVIVSNNYLGTKQKYADLEEKIIRILIR